MRAKVSLLLLLFLSLGLTVRLNPQEPAPPPPKEPPVEEKIIFTLTADKEKYALGETIYLRALLENNGDKNITVLKPFLDNWSVSLAVKIKTNGNPDSKEKEAKEAKSVEFKYTVFHPSVFDNKKELLPKVTLEPGEGTSRLIGLPALKTGEYTINAVYQGAAKPLQSPDVKVNVEGKETDELVAVLQTGLGEIDFRLWPDDAPGTVINFVNLARQGFFNNLIFHRVVPNWVIQSGDPNKDCSGSPGYNIPAEFNKRSHVKGVVSMARRPDHNDSAGSQFFICLQDNHVKLDNQYSAFGEVIQGLDVVDTIGKVETTGPTPKDGPPDKPLKDVVIQKVTIELRAKK